VNRRQYLDWLRGVAVLIMIEAHLFDAWVRVIDRSDRSYRWAIVVGGFSAPLFLFLAGVALALAAGSRLRKGASAGEVAARARARGWQIFGLAYLFRLQSFVISGGAFPQTLLKVDILNVMGLSMVLASVLWRMGARPATRTLMLGFAALGIAMTTPIVRAAAYGASLPYPLSWYLVAVPGSGAFTLFPWTGFLLAGAIVGLWLDQERIDEDERRLMRRLSIIGPGTALAGLAASYLPPLYSSTTFWTGSPTFFFVRLGVLLTAVPAAYVWSARFPGRSPLRDFGVASLFVYWIHVEMVYGVVSLPLHKALTLPQATVAYVAFCLFLFGLVRLKERYWPPAASIPSWRGISPSFLRARLSSVRRTSG
jgi:uncharacterized membrane protein